MTLFPVFSLRFCSVKKNSNTLQLYQGKSKTSFVADKSTFLMSCFSFDQLISLALYILSFRVRPVFPGKEASILKILCFQDQKSISLLRLHYLINCFFSLLDKGAFYFCFKKEKFRLSSIFS